MISGHARPLRALSLPRLLLPLLLAILPVHGTVASGVRDPGSPTILLTGSNRGVGLALAEEYAARGWNVIATTRSPDRATDLQALATRNPKVLIEKLDVTDVGQIAALATKYRGVPVDVLFNNAAWLGEPVKDQQLGNLDQTLFTTVMNTNVYGPLKLSEAFADNVAASDQKKIIGMTSGLGSLTLMGQMSRFYYYQMSKTALNMGMRALRNDLRKRGIIVALLAPGMVETDMLEASGFTGKALTPAESAASLFELVAALTIDDRGIPVNVDGKPIPW